MRLAATEVCLEVHHRIAVPSGQALHRTDQQASEAFGEIGPTEELARILVLVRSLAEVHLPQVGGKLGLLVAPAGHIGVRRDHLAPGFQADRGGTLNGRAGLLPTLAPALFVEADPQQLHFEPIALVRLRRRHRDQQPAGRIQRPVGIVAGKALLVRPPVAMTAQLADKPPLGRAENLSKDRIPGFPHQPEQPGDIPLGHGPIPERVVIEAAQTLEIQPFCCDGALDFAFDKGTEPRPQQVEGLADPVVVGSGHVSAPPLARGKESQRGFRSFPGKDDDSTSQYQKR